MAVFWPHRIDTDMVESLDGTRLGSTNLTIESKKKSLRPPCETSMSSELRPSYGIKSKDEAAPSPNDDTTKGDNGTESGC